MATTHLCKASVMLILALIGAGCGAHAVTSGRVAIRDDRSAQHFSERDRAIIEEYFRAHPAKKTPPGLAKREKLPPGLGKRDTLPPGLEGRSLPRDLESRLTVLPAAQARILLGHDVLLIQRNSRLILDILHATAD